MRPARIKALLSSDKAQEIDTAGWVKTVRQQKNFSFIELNDGSCLSNIQVIVEDSYPEYASLLPKMTTGACLRVKGKLVESPGQKQRWEIRANHLQILGECPAEGYPLQKKRHSFEFLRTIAHLRPRTNTQSAVARIRNALAIATHDFFQKRGFLYINTPLITASDCEGGGQQFLVTTLQLDKVPKTSAGAVDFSQDFFGKPAYLTVSGQLNLETLACALRDVYSFGPTFRAENSNTSRHLAEFWMVEPEMAFADLSDDMECATAYLKHLLGYLLEHQMEDLLFFDQFIEKGLLERLRHVYEQPFAHLTYTDAIAILEKAPVSFEFPVKWGMDLQSEHERYLAEQHCKKPVILTDYPRHIKAFYMRDNEDGKTVAAMDVMVPKIGEIIGGSQREERFDRLKKKIREFGLEESSYEWYLNLREYGTVPHAGFGAGFERLVLFVTGLENVRDAIPFPRFPGHAEF